MITLRPSIDKCPCGSDLIIKNCDCFCSKTQTLHRKPLVLVSPKSDFSHPKCYASPLNGCSKKISKEHFMTRKVLELTAPETGKVRISGFPWQNEKIQDIGIQAFASNILCEAHNNSLSELDELGSKFIESLLFCQKQQSTPQKTQPNTGNTFLFNGYDIEKWLLKCCLGYFSSKNLDHPILGILKTNAIEKNILNILFSSTSLPGLRGMYVIGAKNQMASVDLNISPLVAKDTKNGNRLMIEGFQVTFLGLSIVLALVEPTAGSINGTSYRPTNFVYKTNSDEENIIILSWGHNNSARGKSLVFRSYDPITNKKDSIVMVGPISPFRPDSDL